MRPGALSSLFATPAGFGTNVEHRGEQDTIAEQYLDRGYDVLLGVGSRHFSADDRDDGRDLFADFVREGYNVVRSRGELQGLPGGDRRVLGIFEHGHLPFTIDHVNTPEHTIGRAAPRSPVLEQLDPLRAR